MSPVFGFFLLMGLWVLFLARDDRGGPSKRKGKWGGMP